MALLPTIPTSFVPRSASVERRRISTDLGGLFSYLSYAILGVVFILSIGVFFYGRILAVNKSAKDELLAKAESVKNDFEQIKNMTLKNEKLLKEMRDLESSISRKEEATNTKDKKITSDLTKMHDMQEQLSTEKTRIAKEREELKKEISLAKKTMEEANTRKDDALFVERSTREKIQSDNKKLLILKTQIERELSKAKTAQEKITKAVELRKRYDTAITTTKQDIAKERKQLEEESFASMIEEKSITSPVGQPDIITSKDILRIKNVQVYEKVEACRHALELKDLNSAKQLYNELRELYAKTDLGPTDRDTLYTDIRELYDDIHLMMLG